MSRRTLWWKSNKGERAKLDVTGGRRLAGVNIPPSVTIRGSEYDIYVIDDLAEITDAMGMMNPNLRSVLIESDVRHPMTTADTLVHELVHVLYKEGHVDDVFPKYDEEKIVRLITPGLLSLIVDNPKLIRSIQRLAKKEAE